jgi:DNA-3-methyladenine glycosylase
LLSGNDPHDLRLDKNFYSRDVLLVAPDLLGKSLVSNNNGIQAYFPITEVEAYRGEEDEASHARFGKTSRNQIMYEQGGLVYIYLIYGMYWMLNIVTGDAGQPQAVLVRALENLPGPGILTRALGIDRTYHGEDLATSDRIWISDRGYHPGIIQKPRVGINYAGEPWKSNTWRYIAV